MYYLHGMQSILSYSWFNYPSSASEMQLPCLCWDVLVIRRVTLTPGTRSFHDSFFWLNCASWLITLASHLCAVGSGLQRLSKFPG